MSHEEPPPEPDPRFTLANERTFLAWTRTSLALIAGGVALAELGPHLPGALRTVLAVAPIFTGATLSVLAYFHWRGVDRALQTESPIPRPRFAVGLTTLVVTAGLVLSLTLVFS